MFIPARSLIVGSLNRRSTRLISNKSINDLNSVLRGATSGHSSLEDLKKRGYNAPDRNSRKPRKLPNKTNELNGKDLRDFNKNKKGSHQVNKFNDAKQKPAIKTLNLDKSYDPATYKWTKGKDWIENDYVTEKIKQVHGVNSTFEVIHYTDKGLKHVKLKPFILSLGPEESFDIVNVQTINGVEFPFLRILSKETALKTYTEKLAEEKSKLYGRTREKKREAGLKYLKISWGISFTDLQHQKTNEIIGILKKDQKVVVIIDSKENLNKNLTEMLAFLNKTDKEDNHQSKSKINELELLKREKILNHIKTIEHSKMDVVGDVKSGLVITINPKPHANNSAANDKKSQNHDKKLERKLKQQQREEQKKLAAEAKAKSFNELISKL